MAAPTGNQFWKIRSKHGRDRIFTDENVLWEAAQEYFEWCDANPLQSYEWNGKDPVKCELDKVRAYTLKGLCIYLDVNEKYFNHITEDNKDLINVATRIRQIIYTQKFENAAAGLLNPNIIARDLGLVEKQMTELSGNGLEIIIKGEKFANKD